MQYYVYILTNKNHTVLYTGVTSDLIRRVYEHKNNADPNSFTAKYKVHKLVYFEETSDVKSVIEREKQIKSWKRENKISLIMESNPRFFDLYNQIIGKKGNACPPDHSEGRKAHGNLQHRISKQYNIN